MQAVVKPASTTPCVARKPAPPAPTTTTSNVWSMNLYASAGVEFIVFLDWRGLLGPKSVESRCGAVVLGRRPRNIAPSRGKPLLPGLLLWYSIKVVGPKFSSCERHIRTFR